MNTSNLSDRTMSLKNHYIVFFLLSYASSSLPVFLALLLFRLACLFFFALLSLVGATSLHTKGLFFLSSGSEHL